jgi:hypothetical protein
LKPCVIHLEAEEELREALDYYESRRSGLGGRLRKEFEAALERVRANPQLFAAETDNGVRQCSLRRFPFSLVYLDLDEMVWIVAFANQRRRPGYWARRLRG